jgi:hypothetical protein
MRWLSTDAILEELVARGAPKPDLTDVDAHFAGLAEADPRAALTGCVGHEVITVRGPAGTIETSLQGSAFSRTDVAAYARAVRQRSVH